MEQTGPGQRQINITSATRLFGVLGHPVGHSLSPPMQNAAIAEMGLDAVYLAFDVAPERLEPALRGLADLGAGGVNLTIPLKERALPLLEWVAPEAARIFFTQHRKGQPSQLAQLRVVKRLQSGNILQRPRVQRRHRIQTKQV